MFTNLANELGHHLADDSCKLHEYVQLSSGCDAPLLVDDEFGDYTTLHILQCGAPKLAKLVYNSNI